MTHLWPRTHSAGDFWESVSFQIRKANEERPVAPFPVFLLWPWLGEEVMSERWQPCVT